MSLTNDRHAYVTRMFRRVMNKGILSMEMQMDITCMICDSDLSIDDEIREQACLILILAIKNDQPLAGTIISLLNISASQQSNRHSSRWEKYVVCANMSFHPRYFLSGTIFDNLNSLLDETNNVQLRNSVIWAYATRVKYGVLSNLQQVQMKLLERYLTQPDVSWSISYIIRKMTECSVEQVSEEIWYHFTDIIHSNKYDVGTYNNAFCALNNLISWKHTAQESFACKKHVQKSLEDVIVKESFSKDILANAIRALKAMVINDYTISKETSLKLKELAQDNHPFLSENVKAVLDLLNDDSNEPHRIAILNQYNCRIRTERIAPTKTVFIERLLGRTVEPQGKFLDLEMTIDTYRYENNSNRCEANTECHPEVLTRRHQLSILRSTSDEAENLLKLATNGKYLVPDEIEYLIAKFRDDAKHFTRKERNDIYELIASTFQQLVKSGQRQPITVMELLVYHLTNLTPSSKLARICSDTLLEIAKRDQVIPDHILKQLRDKLSQINDSDVKKIALDILAISSEKGKNDMNMLLNLEDLADDLCRRATTLPVSYLFSRAVLLEKKISAKAFKNLCYVVVTQSDYVSHIDARRHCMKAICYSIKMMDERVSLLPTIQFCLIKAFEDTDEKILSLALQTLCFYCEVECVTHVHPRILNDSVYKILINEINNPSSKKLQNITSLYLQAASKNYLLLKKVLIAVSDLLRVIPDFIIRQKAIWTLKHISEGLRTTVLSSAVLTNMEIALDDPEFDIRITTADVFLNNWQKNPIYFLYKSQKSITKLLTNKFDARIQNRVLSILKTIVEQKQELSNDLMEIIAPFLFEADISRVTLIADILFHYVKYHKLQQNIVHFIEQALYTKQNQDKLIAVLRKCTFHQCILTENTLITLGDILLESIEEMTINNIISTLEFADRNQRLPEIINDLLKYVYYVKVLTNSECEEEVKYAEQQLIEATSNGRQLSKGILSSLQQLISNRKRLISTLQIIVNVTSNGHNLNNDMMIILSNFLREITSTHHVYLIKIFLNVIERNQTPPDTFLVHLQKFIDDATVNTDVIRIYTILLERNASSISTDVIDLIYKLLENMIELNLELKRNLSIFIKLAIESGIAPPRQELLTALLDEKDFLIRNNAIQMIDELVKTREYILSDNILISLSQICLDDKVLKIFETASQIQQLPTYISERLALSHCQNLHQDISQLKTLKSAVSQEQFLLKQHFPELSNLLYSGSEEHRILASEILNIVNSSNQTIPDQVIETVIATLRDESIHLNTLQLLDKAVQCGWKIDKKTIANLIDLATHSSTNIQVKIRAQNILQHEKIADFEIFEKYLCEITINENKQVEKLIGDHKTKIPMHILPLLHEKLTKQQPTTATESKILKVLQCATHNGQSLSDEILCYLSGGLTENNQVICATILCKAIENRQILTDDIIHIIEKSFLLNATEPILDLIRKLAKQYVLFQDDTIKLLIDKSDDNATASSIIEIIAEYQQLPSTMILPYLKKHLSNDDISKVRSSFVVLRYQILKNYIEQPIELLMKITLPSIIDQNKLVMEMSSIDEYLNTVHSLLFVEYFDKDIFVTYSVKQWSREWLCFDLLTRMEIDKNSTEVYAFYHNLSKLEESKGYELYDQVRDDILRFLIKKQSELDLNKINQILLLLEDISISALNSDDSNWYEKLIKCYIQEKVIKHFPQSKYSLAIINHLIDILLDVYNNYLSVDVLISILDSCSEPDELITFIRRISDHKITHDEVNEILFLCKKTKTTLDKQMDMKIVTNKLFQIWKSPLDSLKKADELLRKLSKRWSFSNVCLILDFMNQTTEALTNLIQCLTIIEDYRVDETLANEIILLFRTHQSDICFSKMYKLVIDYCFPISNTVEKSIQQLIKEILENNQSVLQMRDGVELQKILPSFQLASLGKSSLIQTTLPIESWTKNDIQKWSAQVQSNTQWAKKKENLSEIIAVIQHAAYLDNNYKVRHVQLMAVLLLLNTNERNRGRLAQIATGEGKSTIIALLAVIKSLQGLHVDIVTSSTTLAERDAERHAKFYDMFNLSVSHNNDGNTIYISGVKKCYKSSIVYGDVSHFQFDILRDEFSLLNTRGKRPFDVVIIDEVDSMLIDENNKIARLADCILGMEYLNPLLNAIWLAVNNSAVRQTTDKHAIIHNIKSLILNKNPQITVPRHIRSFVLSQLSIWTDNALLARDFYKLDHHYLIKPDGKNINRITPIDYSNTGVIQSSTTWSDGLHQFLQLKHGLKLTPLNLTTNFLSNLGFFCRYEKTVYGLTGTLGSNEAKQLLCHVYSVDTIVLPKYKQTCHIELPSIIVNGEKEWINNIVQNSLTEIRRNRSVLIICETRINAKSIVKELRQHDFKGIVKLYTDNTDTSELNAVNSRANSGDIIVATNLAGRGTDLQTSQVVEDNGGLHVCLTFMPINFRVEQQAFGRTSRNGNRGTSQLILNTDNVLPRLYSLYPKFIEEHHDLSKDDLQKIEYLRDWRNKAEAAQLNEIHTKDIPEIESNDNLFQKFCRLLADLRQIDNDEYKLNSVKERWGLWLKDKDQRDKVKLSLLENAKMAGFKFRDENSNSFFHVINQQLEKCSTNEELKIQMIKHIIKNKTCYEDFLKNLDNDIHILYVEEMMMKVLMRTININIVVVTTDDDPIKVYKRHGAIETIYLAGEIDHSYYALSMIDEKTILNYVSEYEDEDNTPVKTTFIEDQLDFQLYKKLDRVFDQQNYLKEYDQFEQEIRNQYKIHDTIIQNPFYHITKADMLIEKTHQFPGQAKHVVRKITSFGTKGSTDRKKAFQCLDAAIELDPIYSFTAYVSRAYLLIEQHTSKYKEDAKADLLKAQDQINSFILPGMHSMQLNLDKSSEDFHNYDELSKQLTIKIDIIHSYNAHIENAILAIENSQKLVDITITNAQSIDTMMKLERYKALNLINPNKDTFKKSVKENVDNRKYKLTFHNLLVHKDIVMRKDEVETLINLIKKKPDYHHISIQFQQIIETSAANIIQSFEKILDHATLRIDCLNKEELSKLFERMKPSQRMIDISMTLKNRNQYKCIILISNTTVTINTSEKKAMIFLSSNEALDYLNQNTDEQILSMSITSMNMQFFKSLKNMSLDGAVFSLTFNKLSTMDILNVIKSIDKHLFLEFTDLNYDKALSILQTRAERDFLICLDNLNNKEAQRILKEFDPNEQDVNVDLKRIADRYLQNNKPDDELNEFDQHGINKLIIINELNPIPWFSVASIIALGTAQIIGGVCLTAFTCGIGVTLGTSLITEGVSDLYFALRGVISRNINWKDYAIQKGVSLAVCFATLGLSVVSQSVRAVQQVGTKTRPQFVKQTLTGMKNLIQTSFQTIGQEAAETAVRNSLVLGCKQVAVTSAEIGAKELLNYSTNGILNNHFIADIKLEIGDYVESSLNEMIDGDLEYRTMLEKIFFNDCYNRNYQWQNQIEQIAANILNTSNEYIQAAKSLAEGASNGLLNHLKKAGGTTTKSMLNILQNSLNIVETVRKAVRSTTLTKEFFHAFKNELQKQAKGMPDLKELLSKEQNIGQEIAEAIIRILTDHHILTQDELLNQDLFLEDQNENNIERIITNEQITDCRFSVRKLQFVIEKIDLKISGCDYRTIVKNFFVRALSNTYQKSILQKKIHTLIVDHLMLFIKGILIEPLKKYIIGKTVQLISHGIQRKLDADNQTITEKIECDGAKRYINNVTNKFIEDVQCGNIQIESNAREQLEIIVKRPSADRTHCENFILSVLSNKEGGIVELGLISAMTGLKFSVIESEECGEEAKHNGKIQLIYIKAETNDTHQMCRGNYWKSVGDRNRFDVDGRNDSLYNAIYTQAPDRFTSPEQIKSQLAEFMCGNLAYIQRIQPAINIINVNSNPICRRTLLMEGGITNVDKLQIEIKLNDFIQSNNKGLAIVDAIKTLAVWISNNHQEITLSIDMARKLFPKLISPKAARMGEQSVTFIKRSTNILDKCQNRDYIGIIEELIHIGDIIFTLYETGKSE